MRLWILAAVLAAACASAEPAQQADSSNTSPAAAPAAEYASDARSVASDAEVGEARRAYRAACQARHSSGYCECMTGGMAQALAPAELAVATAEFTGQSVAASQDVRSRVAATRAEVDSGCAQFRG